MEGSDFKLTLLHPFVYTFVAVRGSLEARGERTALRARVRPEVGALLAWASYGLITLAASVVLLIQGRWTEGAYLFLFLGSLLLGGFLLYKRFARRAVQLLGEVAATPRGLLVAAGPVVEVLESEGFFRHADALRSAAREGDGGRIAEMCEPSQLGDFRVESVSGAEWWDMVASLKREALRFSEFEPSPRGAV